MSTQLFDQSLKSANRYSGGTPGTGRKRRLLYVIVRLADHRIRRNGDSVKNHLLRNRSAHTLRAHRYRFHSFSWLQRKQDHAQLTFCILRRNHRSRRMPRCRTKNLAALQFLSDNSQTFGWFCIPDGKQMSRKGVAGNLRQLFFIAVQSHQRDSIDVALEYPPNREISPPDKAQ